jgi:DNA-binding transcriptional MerR regulator
MTYQKEKTYGIGDAAKMANCTTRQLRLWEENGYLPQLDRLVCGDRAYRRFSFKDVELARLIKKYLDEGFRLQAAAERARADMGGVK